MSTPAQQIKAIRKAAAGVAPVKRIVTVTQSLDDRDSYSDDAGNVYTAEQLDALSDRYFLIIVGREHDPRRTWA